MSHMRNRSRKCRYCGAPTGHKRKKCSECAAITPEASAKGTMPFSKKVIAEFNRLRGKG